jgi:hypothetical protein
MSTAKQEPQRRRRSVSSKAAARNGTDERRGMSLAKQASVVIGLVSGGVGLFFLFFPQFRPERHEPAPDQSARVYAVATNPHTTHGNFLDYADRSKLGFTKEQLAEVGASAFARIEIAGYRNKHLILERQVVNARNGNVVGKTTDLTVTPPADRVTHRWSEWIPLRPGRGSYVMVIKLLDRRPEGAIACGQTSEFGGLGGLVPATTPPHVCEGP